MMKRLVTFGLIAIFLISVASAEVFLSKQPNDLYTLGEELKVTIGTDREVGWANLDLVCNNQTKLLFFNHFGEKDTKKELVFPLTLNFLRGMSGNCHLLLTFNEISKKSMDFKIADDIGIDMTFNTMEFEPNTTIKFEGTTNKPNRETVTGFAEVSLDKTELEIITPIEKNKFNGELILPENLASGVYTLNVFAYEKEEEEITNNGLRNFTITILQKPRSLELSCLEEVKAGGDLEIKAILYDQAEHTIEGEQVLFILTNSQGEEIFNILTTTGESTIYKVKKNNPLGYINLSAESKEITEQMQIYVGSNKEAIFELINDTLAIKNIGNVPYDKFVEISIGNHTEIKDINISVGKSLEFELKAPDGEYNIKVKDDTQEIEGSALLTGSAISIKGKKSTLEMMSKGFFAWLFVILILGIFVFVASKRVIDKKSILPEKLSKKLNFKNRIKNKINFKKKSPYEGGVVKITPHTKTSKPEILGNTDASHSLVIDGEKQKSSILALKIKNMDDIKKSKSNAGEDLQNAVNLISENNGKIYKTENYIVGIFTPSITKTFNNSFNTLKLAEEISGKLREHNSRFTQKINFGIGINSGDIVAKKQNNKLLFTSLGNGLSDAKKISEIADNCVLLGESTSKEVTSKAKLAPYVAKFGLKTFSVKKLLDRSNNKKFIDGFLKRNQEYKKLDEFRV